MLVPLCCPRLKPKNIEKVLQEYGNRARKLEGQKLNLGDFAQFLDVPLSDMLRDMFALFDEVKVSLTTIIKFSRIPPSSQYNVLCFNPCYNALLFIQRYICIYNPQKNHHHFIAAMCSQPKRAAASCVKLRRGLVHLLSSVSPCFVLGFFQHEDNCMDIREYVIALSVVCRPAKTLETMKLAFKVCFVSRFISPPGRMQFSLLSYRDMLQRHIRPSCLQLERDWIHLEGNICISFPSVGAQSSTFTSDEMCNNGILV